MSIKVRSGARTGLCYAFTAIWGFGDFVAHPVSKVAPDVSQACLICNAKNALCGALFHDAQAGRVRTACRPTRRLPEGSQKMLIAFESSFNHLVSSCQQSIWKGKAKCLGGFEIDDKLELGRLLDRQRLGLNSFGDLVQVVG